MIVYSAYIYGVNFIARFRWENGFPWLQSESTLVEKC